MKYPRIIAEIERLHWAITPEALDGIRKAVDGGLSADDYALFHKSTEIEAFDSAEESKPLVVDGKGIIVINGPIVPRATAFTKVSGLVAIDKLTEDFKTLEADDMVDEIRFLVDSPGGAVTGVSDFAQLVKASKKKTSAFIVGQAASAAYWIISAVDKIVSSDTGLSGSIGVVMTYYKGGKDGEGQILSAQSPDKRADPETKEGRAILQKLVNEIADVFIGAVAENRGVTVETVLKDFGRGAMFVAKRASSVGMIDEVMTINEFMTSSGKKDEYESAQALDDKRLPNAETKPAQIAGERTQHMQNLADFLAENPAAMAEYEAAKAKEFEAGKAAGKKELQANHAKMAVYLKGDEYPAKFKNVVIQGIEGKKSFEAIESMADMLDILQEEQNSAAAQEESEALPETPPAVTDKLSEDGQIKNMADVTAFWSQFKGNGGEAEVS